MAEPDNMMLRLLRDIRAEMTGHFDTLRGEVTALRDEVRANTKRLDNVRDAITGESVLGRYAAAEVEQRRETIEKRLSDLEKSR